MRTLIVALILLVAAAAPARAETAAEFEADAKLFYRVVACGGSDPVDASIEKVVASHCKWMKSRIAEFKKKFITPASSFFDGVRPSNLPTTVVYPFGGGDLVSALVTFPGATEITTMSLEHTGDPTRLAKLSPRQLKKYLARFRKVALNLLAHTVSKSTEMQQLERGPIPGQLAFHMLGAAMMGYEPVSLRFFTLGADGAVDYYSDDEVTALAGSRAKKKKGSWVDTDWSVAFANMELELRRPDGTQVVHRHLAVNLDDEHFAGSALEKHLEAKGTVSAMTKGASYLLWKPDFSKIRDYLAGHLAWMASDSTGILPRDAQKASLEQETYGHFVGPRLKVFKYPQTAQMVKLWKKQEYRKLGFSYGYRDTYNRGHLMITRPKVEKP